MLGSLALPLSYTASMTLFASGANIIALLWLIIELSMTATFPTPLAQVLPVSALLDFLAFASTSCWRIGPPVWMKFPDDTPMTLPCGSVHVAAGSSKMFQAPHVIDVPFTTARI